MFNILEECINFEMKIGEKCCRQLYLFIDLPDKL